MARGVLRLLIQSIQVKSNGDVPEDQKPKTGTSNLLVATLRYPRSGAPSVVTTFPLDLKDNVVHNFDVGDFFGSVIFKEEIDTETILKIQLLDRQEPSTFTKVVAALAGAIFGAALDGIVGGISNAIVGAVAALPVTSLKSSFKLDGETTTVLGEGEIKLSVGSIPGTLAVPLTVPEDVTEEYYGFAQPGGGQPQKMRKVILKKNDSLGTVNFIADMELL